MDFINKEDLDKLVNHKNGLLLTIYIPTYKRGTDTLQNRIRFKNLTKKIKEEFIDNEYITSKLSGLLEKAEEQLDNYEFWQHQSDCLAIFLSDDYLKYYRLPLKLDEFFCVGNNYYILPLVSFFNSTTDFYVLYLSQKEISLYSAEKFELNKVQIKELYDITSEELNNRDFQKQLQFHTVAGAGGRKDSMFYGTGAKDLQINKYLLNFFNKIDRVIRKNLIGKRPLILAGADYIFPIYRIANSYPWIMEEVIHLNPKELNKKRTMEKASTIIKKHIKSKIEEEYKKLLELKNTPKDMYSLDLGSILKTSIYGKIDELFITAGKMIWGKYNEKSNKVKLHKKPGPDSDELLNFAAVNTIMNGGEVFIIDPEKNYDIPVAARFRY